MENKNWTAVPYLKVFFKQLRQYCKFQCKQHSWKTKGDGLTRDNLEYNGEKKESIPQEMENKLVLMDRRSGQEKTN